MQEYADGWMIVGMLLVRFLNTAARPARVQQLQPVLQFMLHTTVHFTLMKGLFTLMDRSL